MFAENLLALGRSSYRLRDDDNIYIGRIKSQIARAVDEAKARLVERSESGWPAGDIETSRSDIVKALRDRDYVPPSGNDEARQVNERSSLRARQLVGQPAGPGIGQGRARVVLAPDDLVRFKAGEILVCEKD